MATDAPRYRRRREGRLVAGVAGGLADHLGLDPLKVRIGFAVLAGLGGFGLVLYGGYWMFVPQAGAEQPRTPAGLRAASRSGLRSVPARVFDEQQPIQLIALLAVALGAVLLGQRAGLGVPGIVLWPALAIGAGLAVLWRQVDEADLAPTGPAGGPSRARRVFGAARFVAGAALVGLGLATFLLFSADPASAARGLTGGAVVVVGAALIAGPWLLRIWQSLSAERAERIRSQAHADLAAHLHDSVLQTLALIQRQAYDPRAVIRLARGQERDLRTFLYAEQSASDGGDTVAGALRRVCAEVEESAGVPVELVTVGDGPLDEARGAWSPPPARRWSTPRNTPGPTASTCTPRSTRRGRACSSGTGASGSTPRRCRWTGRASATRSSGAWCATVAAPSCGPRRVRAPRWN